MNYPTSRETGRFHQPADETPTDDHRPLLLAEQCDRDTLQSFYDLSVGMLDTNRTREQAETEFVRGSACLELGLHPDTDPEAVDDFLDDAHIYLSRVADTSVSFSRYGLFAGGLIAQLPWFEARAYDEAPTAEEILEVRQTMATLAIQAEDTFAGNESIFITGRRALTTSLLLARVGILNYIGTSREQTLGLADVIPKGDKRLRHVCYTVDNEVKIPYVMTGYNTKDTQGLQTVDVFFSQMIKDVFEEPGSIRDIKDTLKDLEIDVVHWLHDEAHGQSLSEDQRTLLGGLAKRLKRQGGKYLQAQSEIAETPEA